MEILHYINIVISTIIVLFLVLPFLSTMLSLLASNLDYLNKDSQYQQKVDFACIVTAYRDLDITREGIKSLLDQNYHSYHVYLVADECTDMQYDLGDPKLTVLYPAEPLKLKVKSIIYAVSNFVRSHDFIVVLDADNIVEESFLKKMTDYTRNGHVAIQGRRKAKKLTTIVSCLDAAGEYYKNYVERLAPAKIGSSSVISGSGMAIETNLYKSYLQSKEIQEGKLKWKKMLQEDKILQNHIVKSNGRIVFADEIIIYDEKIQNTKQVETQRSRWLYSYFQNIPNALRLTVSGMIRLKWNKFYFGLITLSPPLFILLLSAMIAFIINIFTLPLISGALFIGLALFVTNFFLVLYLSKIETKVWSSLRYLPVFIWHQFLALFKMVNPNKNFHHTEHSSID